MSDNEPVRNITALIVNYRTLDLTMRCVESLRQHYPHLRLILVDNGSQDASTEYLRQLGAQFPQVQCLLNQANLYHGPAMNLGIRASVTPHVFLLDSDCEVRQGGFLEAMAAGFSDSAVYAIGRVMVKNRYGFEVREGMRPYAKYVHPSAMLLHKEKYLQLKPFVHHGAPCLKNMKDAEQHGFKLLDFPIGEFVRHAGRGTCSRYGYSLGPLTWVQYILTDYLPTRLARHGPRHPIV